MDSFKDEYNNSTDRPFDINLIKFSIPELIQLLEEGFDITCTQLCDYLHLLDMSKTCDLTRDLIVRLIPRGSRLHVPISLSRDYIDALLENGLVEDYTINYCPTLHHYLNSLDNIDLIRDKDIQFVPGLLSSMLQYIGVEVKLIHTHIKIEFDHRNYNEILDSLRDKNNYKNVDSQLIACILDIGSKKEFDINYLPIIISLIDISHVGAWRLLLLLDANNHIKLEDHIGEHWSIDRLINIKKNRY